jgi:TolB-like protein
MVATVSPWASSSAGPAMPAGSDDPKRGLRPRTFVIWAGGAALCLLLVGALMLHGKIRSNHPSTLPAHVPPQKSIAVLPFLDLTEGMKEEPFADGMTEELIDKLSKVPEFRVPAPTSSFYFKGRQIPIADIARSLGVMYVLDGSVRKSGGQLRVAARLMRADNGYIMWSETYDRPFDDILMVQDDIAGEVTKALRSSIETKADHDVPR